MDNEEKKTLLTDEGINNETDSVTEPAEQNADAPVDLTAEQMEAIFAADEAQAEDSGAVEAVDAPEFERDTETAEDAAEPVLVEEQASESAEAESLTDEGLLDDENHAETMLIITPETPSAGLTPDAPPSDEELRLLSPILSVRTETGPKRVNLLRVSEKRLTDLLVNEIAAGKNEAGHKLSVSTMQIDDKWIDTVENAVQSMEAIMRDPKTFIKEEREVVGVEKVRKVDHQTVRHLSSNTQNVRKVFDDGRVQPTKLLTKFLETEYAIYENRVVYSLLQRLKPFIEVRYRAIKVIVEQEINDVKIASKFKFSDIDFDVDMTLRASTPSADKSHMERNLRLLEKLENIKKRLQSLETTQFCQILKGSKLVTPPLQKTNIFKSNIDYRSCYSLWMYISSFTEVGYSVEVSEKDLPIDTTYYQDLCRIIAQSAMTVLKTNAIRADAYKSLMYQKKDVKQHKLSRSVDIDHKAPHNLLEDETNLNQFYFERIRNLVKGLKDKKKGDGVYEKDINADFKRLFKGLNRLNNEVFLDAIRAKEPDANKKAVKATDDTPIGKQIAKKRNEIINDRKLLAKLQTLMHLKEEDMNAMRRRVKNQIKKLDSQEKDLERKIALKIAADKKREADRLRKEKEAEKKRILAEKEALLKRKKREQELQRKALLKEKEAEKKRLAAEALKAKKAEDDAARAAEAERLRAEEAEKKRIELEKKKAEAAEKRRIESEKRKAEAAEKRKAAIEERRKLAAEQKAAEQRPLTEEEERNRRLEEFLERTRASRVRPGDALSGSKAKKTGESKPKNAPQKNDKGQE